MNTLISKCDNPLHGLASELAVKACDVVRSCVGGALTAIKEVVEVASEVRACLPACLEGPTVERGVWDGEHRCYASQQTGRCEKETTSRSHSRLWFSLDFPFQGLEG